MELKICDVPLHELKIGQVVRFPACWGCLIQVTTEIRGKWLDQENIKRLRYPNERYSTATFLLNNGRISGAYFIIAIDHVLYDRVILDLNITQHPKGTEFFRFNEICEEEQHTWKPLLKDHHRDHGNV